MIEITEESKTWPSGPCKLAANTETDGWFQRQDSTDRIKLEVVLAQYRFSFCGWITQTSLKGVVDTGSRWTILSRNLFEASGFHVPKTPATNLPISGVVRRSRGKTELEDYLWGWKDIKIRVDLPQGPYGKLLKLPSCSLDVVVAENVDDSQFIIGLDFLKHFGVLMRRDLLIILSQ